MENPKSEKTNDKQNHQIDEFVKKNGWYIPSLHERYLFSKDIKESLYDDVYQTR